MNIEVRLEARNAFNHPGVRRAETSVMIPAGQFPNRPFGPREIYELGLSTMFGRRTPDD